MATIVSVTIKLSEAVKKRLAIYAINNNVNQSAVVESALIEFLDNKEKKKEWKQ